MTARRRIKLQIGKQVVGKTIYDSEPYFIQEVNRTMKEVTDQLIGICEGFEGATEDIIMEAMRPTFDKSQEYCPKDTGELRRSGYLEVVGFRGKPRVEMGYAKGGKPFYAALVHENVDSWHAYPTQAKFLQRAVEEDLDDIQARISRGYRELLVR